MKHVKESAKARLEVVAGDDPKKITLVNQVNNVVDKNLARNNKLDVLSFNVDFEGDTLKIELEVKTPMDISALTEITSTMMQVERKFKLKEKDMKMSEDGGRQNFLFLFNADWL